MRRSKGEVSCVTGRAFASVSQIDLIKVYNVLPCHADHLPTDIPKALKRDCIYNIDMLF